ncbi:MAG: hypothetical protein ABIQ89_04275 [Candidatus Saccharimonadales bacterium]
MRELVHLAEFQAILESPKHKYQPSDESQAIVRQTRMALFVGPTNAGRNTIINKLIPKGSYYFVISDTTRPPKLRNGVTEQDGVEYWFRKEKDVLSDLKTGRFVEAAIIHEQQVSGMSVREIAIAQAQNKVAVTDIEIVGVESVRAIKPDVICIFVLPPSFEQWQRRLNKRDDISVTELARRMRSSIREFTAALKHPYYWFVMNNDLTEATDYVDQLVKTGKPDPDKQAEGRAIAEDLLRQTKQFLEDM